MFILSLLFVFNLTLAGINDGLVAYYPFDGNALDASGNGGHGSNRTGLVTYNAGKIGQAAWFDGESCLILPQPRLLDGASNATVCAWVYLANGQSGQILATGDGRPERDPISTRINATSAQDCRFEEVINNQQVTIGFLYGGFLPGLSVGSWHLYSQVLERVGSQSVVRCYMDGDLALQTTNSQFSHIAYDLDMPPLVGAIESASPWQFWNGGIDELRVYDRALSGAEIAGLYYAANPALTISVSQVRICWFAPADTVSQIQYRSELTANTWSNLGAPVIGYGTNVCITDEVGGPQRYYRVTFEP